VPEQVPISPAEDRSGPSVPSALRRARSRWIDLHPPLDWLRWIGRNTKRLAVLVIGVAILGAGVAMLALPGPGVLVIVVGLAVLATEFAWAERALDRTTARAASAVTKVSGSRSGRMALIASGLGMIVGGALVVAIVGSFRVVGASVAFAGLVGLATLHPRGQRWLDEQTNAAPSPPLVAPVAAPVTGPAAIPPPPPHYTNGVPS